MFTYISGKKERNKKRERKKRGDRRERKIEREREERNRVMEESLEIF